MILWIERLSAQYQALMEWLTPFGSILLALVRPLGTIIERAVEPHRDIIATIIYYDGFRIFSALMYMCFCVGLWILGFKYYDAVKNKDPQVGQFPKAYFFWLAVSLIPITITGFVHGDTYIIATRLITLVSILAVHGLVKSADGVFNTWRNKFWIGFWLAAFSIGPMVWTHSRIVQTFVSEFEKPIAWSSVAVMILFMIRGQITVAKDLFRHYVEGSDSAKRFTSQIFRFNAFFPQSLHYWLAPLAVGGAIAWNNAIAWQGFLGLVGVVWVLTGSILGLIQGTAARRRLRRERTNYLPGYPRAA